MPEHLTTDILATDLNAPMLAIAEAGNPLLVAQAERISEWNSALDR